MTTPMKRSTIVQKEVSSLSAIGSQTFTYDPRTGQTPIVVVPRNPCLFHCCTNVPSGYSILFQKWNAKFDPPLRKEGLMYVVQSYNSYNSSCDTQRVRHTPLVRAQHDHNRIITYHNLSQQK